MSQEVVYRSQILEPIFKGRNKDELNIYWLLHVVNHFKFHLKQRVEGILEHFYRGFPTKDLPRAWIGTLKTETTELPRRWKGAASKISETIMKLELIYRAAFLDEAETVSIRSIPDRFEHTRGVWVDQVCEGNDGFQVFTSLLSRCLSGECSQ
jgi:hypothetical protein